MNDKLQNKMAKQIPTSHLPQALQESLTSALENLKNLKSDIENKQIYITNKSSELIAGYNQLSSNKSIKMNVDTKETFEKSAKHFVSLSSILSGEIDHYVSFYNRHLDNDAPKEVTVGLNASGSFEDYISAAIKLIKTYLKNRSKEISVIFSRYDHGLTAQQRKLTSLEHMLSNMQSAPEAKQQPALATEPTT